LFVAAASPGPGIAALVARVSRFRRPPWPSPPALILGDLVWLAVAISVLAVVAQTFTRFFLVIKYAGATTLLYLATGCGPRR